MFEPGDLDGMDRQHEARIVLLAVIVAIIVIVALALSWSCGPVSIKTPTPQPPPSPTAYNIGCVVKDGSGQPVQDATCALGSVTGQTNADGYVLLKAIPACASDGCATVTVTKASYDTAAVRLAVDAYKDVAVTLQASHVDPSGIPLGQLAAIRGAMWPSASRCPGGLILPFGPRPNQPNNILATDFIADYSADQREAIVACLKALGYTHVVMGPLVDSDGYHGQYTPHDWRGDAFNGFLDLAQFFWDHQLAPVVFLHPDGWTFEQTRDTFTPLLQTARAQRLLRIVVPAGWEPTRYGWSSCTWANFARWGRETLPNALILLHTVADVDAPVGTDALCDDNGKPNGDGWARIVPYIHGWLIQNGAYTQAPSENPTLARNFAAQFKADGDGATLHSVAWHFAGHAGWPTTSAWGNVPILLYAGETTAYSGYWDAMPEEKRIAWGDLAVQSGAAGYLDGGTVSVPITR